MVVISTNKDSTMSSVNVDKRKVSILVHPGWINKDLTSGYDITHYHKIIDDMDMTFIYVPMVSSDIKRVLFKRYIGDVIDYYMFSKRTDLVHRIFHIEEYKVIFNSLIDKVRNEYSNSTVTVGKIKGKLKRIDYTIRNRLVKILTRMYMDKPDSEYWDVLFNSDYTHIPGYMELYNKLTSKYKNDSNVRIFKYGSIHMVNILAEHVYTNSKVLTMLKNADIYLFGEHYEECVKSHGLLLDRLDIKYTKLKEYSVHRVTEDSEHKDNLNEFYYIVDKRGDNDA